MLFSGDPLPDIRRRSLAVEPHDVPPECISDRGRSDPAGARFIVHEYLGHRVADAHIRANTKVQVGWPFGDSSTHSFPWTRPHDP
jgi:hypothetical protein